MHSMSIEIQATKAQGYNRLGKTISLLDHGSILQWNKKNVAIKWNISRWFEESYWIIFILWKFLMFMTFVFALTYSFYSKEMWV